MISEITSGVRRLQGPIGSGVPNVRFTSNGVNTSENVRTELL